MSLFGHNHVDWSRILSVRWFYVWNSGVNTHIAHVFTKKDEHPRGFGDFHSQKNHEVCEKKNSRLITRKTFVKGKAENYWSKSSVNAFHAKELKKINFKARLQSFNICVRFSIRLQKAAAPTKNSFSICMHAWIHSPHNNNFFRAVKHKIFNHQCFIGTHHRTRQKLNCFYLHGLMQTTVLQCAAQKPRPKPQTRHSSNQAAWKKWIIQSKAFNQFFAGKSNKFRQRCRHRSLVEQNFFWWLQFRWLTFG